MAGLIIVIIIIILIALAYWWFSCTTVCQKPTPLSLGYGYGGYVVPERVSNVDVQRTNGGYNIQRTVKTVPHTVSGVQGLGQQIIYE